MAASSLSSLSSVLNQPSHCAFLRKLHGRCRRFSLSLRFLSPAMASPGSLRFSHHHHHCTARPVRKSSHLGLSRSFSASQPLRSNNTEAPPSLKHFVAQAALASSEIQRDHVPASEVSSTSRGRIYHETYGCQMNINDMEIVLSIMKSAGYGETVGVPESAEIIFINTCAIRDNAEQKVWQRLNYFWFLKRHWKSNVAIGRSQSTRPPKVVVLGCMAERLKDKILDSDKMVDVVCGPDAYRDLPRLLEEVIINVGMMNKIISFDQVSGILVCEAGCILENLITFLDTQGFIMPLDLGAKGSCQIGGNVSTNAGGLRLVRYGSLHGNVLGVEAVLANGDVLDMLGTLRKDNTGYDLKHLFIGSEGTLGILTKVSILTPPKLSSVNLAFLACSDYLSCQKLLMEAKRKLGEILSAFEFLDNLAMDLVLNHLDGIRNPLPPSLHNFYVLIETTGSHESYDREKLEAFLLHVLEAGLVSDGALAQDINQASSFWRIREGLPEALMKAGAVYKYDLSIPVESMYNLVEDMRARLGASAKVVAYGHLGDSNLHLNISAHQYDEKILAQIEPFVYEWTSKHRGSISAEHGLGLMKANKIFHSKQMKTVQLMASIKKLLDPREILNPYKVLPHSLTT